MRLSLRRLVVACLLTVALVAPARAGMAGPLPDNPELIWRLTDSAVARLQAISFFLAGILLSALVVKLLWNYVRRDFPKLPRLSFGKALAGVFLWGLLFVIVLAMISGARELMTPRAWQKQGFLYKLTDEAADPGPTALRHKALERLRHSLWHFAATHAGRFPSEEEAGEMPRSLWEVPESGGMRYLYVAGLSASNAAAPLVCEPEFEAGRRLVLRTDGEVVEMASEEVARAFKEQHR